MNKITDLNPKLIWKNFAKICSIPHPSKKEKKIVEFIKSFGENLNLETIVDEAGNVIIRKPATKGFENRKGVILQGHLDMVPQANSDSNHDFEKDPIEAYVDGEWVTANGTTLGADNGIGVAAAMAVLESNDIEHGPIEALFTVDEETGMTGAFELKPGILKGEILLNMDSEDEGELYVGCAGGMDANIRMEYNTVKVPENMKGYKLSITGLKGGHSGLDINLGRGNANKILIRFLKKATKDFGLRMVSINGGSLRNAIPRESFAHVLIPSENNDKFIASVNDFNELIKSEIGRVETDFNFTAQETNVPEKMIDEFSQYNLINSVYACPNGVIRMSDAFEGVVETSNNIAIVKSDNGYFVINCLLRSSIDSAKYNLAEMICSVFDLAGAEIELTGEYPGWKPNPNSDILQVMKKSYQNLYNKTPEIKVIHAGLECGILGSKYPNWDMISFGPTIRFPHSPDEKVNIESVQKFWNYLIETLKNIPIKQFNS
ncbi:MAG: aminoacyl-histidine dipeptidase [Marinilabiliales bacterium]